MSDPVGLARGLTHYGDPDFALFLRRSFARSMGYSADLLAQPMVGIAETASDFNNCHRHFPELIEAVKRGVLPPGGLPLASRQFRWAKSSYPDQPDVSQSHGDGRGGNVPRPADRRGGSGRRLRQDRPGTADGRGLGRSARDPAGCRTDADRALAGERLGACTDCRRFWASSAPAKSSDEIDEVEGALRPPPAPARSWARRAPWPAIAEALGMLLPGTAAIPAVHADRLRAAEASGRAAIRCRAPVTPDRIITAQSVENALRVLLAIGGSTNAIIHLTAIAGRAGIDVSLATPQRALRRDAGAGRSEANRRALHGRSFAAGGMGAVLRELKPLLHLDCLTVTGEPWGRLAHEPPGRSRDGRPLATRCSRWEGWSHCWVARAERSDPQALRRRSEAFRAEGRAVVFTSLDDLAARSTIPL